MKKNKKIFLVVLLLAAFLLTIFPLITQAEEDPIPQDKPASDEMTVYFIRDSASYGALRRIWVACNENAIASLSSGSYCCFKVKSGPNILNLVQEKTPVGFYLLKYNPNETVYLLLDYMRGKITKVAPYFGEGLIKEFKNEPLLKEPGSNDAYEYSIFNPGIFDIEHMKKAEEMSDPDTDNAVITFIRPDKFARIQTLGIWSEEGYLGSLTGKTFLQIKVKPGKHYFIGNSGGFSIVEAEVEAGKKYYIELKTKMGWRFMNLQLLPVKKEIDDKTLQEWLTNSINITYDSDSATDDLLALMEKARLAIGAILEKVESGEIKTTKLSAEDAR